MERHTIHRQRGAAVILAMLTVALVAVLAASALGEFGVALEGTAGRHDQAQARLLARGAVDFARNVLADDALTTSVDHFGEPWAVKVPPTQVEDGQIGGELQELSGRFNLNNLVVNGQVDEVEAATYTRLLGMLGIPQDEAAGLVAALADWLDPDDTPRPGGAESPWYMALPDARRAANMPLTEVAELIQVRGYTQERIAGLKPFVAALPAGTRINVNTASPEVLAAAVPDLSLDQARALVAQRSTAWFKDLADFTSRLPGRANTTGLDRNHLATTSRHFLAIGNARYGVAVVRMEVLLDRKLNWPEIVWQKLK